ncbi:MAG: hypothetical protein QOH66_1797 [Actinomycetota bacterium]|jgi:hypothetical protein|nr:hypothetical protein [Actinomycetota bacterium]
MKTLELVHEGETYQGPIGAEALSGERTEASTSPRRGPARDEDVLSVSAVVAKRAIAWGAVGAASGISVVLLLAMVAIGLGAVGTMLGPWIWAAAFAAAAAGVTAGGMVGGMRAMHAFDLAGQSRP